MQFFLNDLIKPIGGRAKEIARVQVSLLTQRIATRCSSSAETGSSFMCR